MGSIMPWCHIARAGKALDCAAADDKKIGVNNRYPGIYLLKQSLPCFVNRFMDHLFYSKWQCLWPLWPHNLQMATIEQSQYTVLNMLCYFGWQWASQGLMSKSSSGITMTTIASLIQHESSSSTICSKHVGHMQIHLRIGHGSEHPQS